MKNTNRRNFIKWLAASGAIALAPPVKARVGKRRSSAQEKLANKLRVGLITDTHWGELPDRPQRPRFFRYSLDNTRETMELFNEKQVDFVIHLGDIIQESGERQTTLEWLGQMDNAMHVYNGPVYYAMGNHDLVDLSKEDVLSVITGTINLPYYHFDQGDRRFIVLDTNYTQDQISYNRGNFSWTDTFLPDEQAGWLEGLIDDAGKRGLKVWVFTHQCFDNRSKRPMVKNAPQLRAMFEHKGNVEAVVYGHRHNGAYENINGIHYLNMFATVNGTDLCAGILSMGSDGSLALEGVGNRQPSWQPA